MIGSKYNNFLYRSPLVTYDLIIITATINDLTIYGAYTYEVATIPDVLPEVAFRAIDMDQYQVWIGSKDKSEQKLLNKIPLRHVTNALFTESVQTCVESFLSQDIPQKYIAFAEPGKSQTWATRIAMDGGLTPSLFLRIGEVGANGLEYSISQYGKENFPTDISNFVFADDGACTGCQNVS